MSWNEKDCQVGRDLLWTPNNGNTPANELRAKEFAESALAAYKGYASTKNVKTPEKTSMVLFVCD
jgi:hypothetical protein